MKRILIFSTAYLPHVGGAEIAIKEITDRLADVYAFDLICARIDRSLPSRERIGKVNVYRIGVGVPFVDKLLVAAWGARVAVRLNRMHSYACYWAVMVTFGSIAAYIANMLSKPVPIVLTLQEGDSSAHIHRARLGLVGRAWHFMLKRATRVTVISEYLGCLAREFGYGGTAVVIPNGVDFEHFSHTPPQSRVNELQVHLGKTLDDVYLVTTSRLVHKNALDDVIRALPHLDERVHFVIGGIGPDEAFLRKLAADKGVSHRVHFCGNVRHADVPVYLHACDIFVRPSRSEGMGNSFVEAMAAGIPVIGTQEGGISDFLFDAKRNPHVTTTGWAVDANAPEQIVTAVKDILAHPETVQAVTSAARALVREKYDWNLIAQMMRTRVFEDI